MSTEHMKIAMIAVVSSQIAAIGYAEESKTMRITFADRKDKAGAVIGKGSSYDYDNVEAETHQALMKAESVGSYFYAHIKPNRDKYPYRKLEGHYPAPVQEPRREQETTA